MRHLNCIDFFIIIGLMLLTSCEYQLDSENFRDISKPDTTQGINIELSPADTSYLFAVPMDIHYNLNTFGLSIYNVEVFMDDVSIYKGNQPDANFWFDPANFGTGDRILSLVVTTNTNTLSLADLTGWEGLVFMKQWNVHVDGCCPTPIEIIRIFNDNGLLKVEWEPYERLNFQQYRVWVNYSELEGPYYSHMVAEISDPDQTWWFDSSFVGGTPDYWIEVMGSNQYASGERTRFEYSYPKLDTLWQRGDSALFYWNKHDFYRSLNSYMITTSGSYPYDQEELFSTTDANDTTFLIRNMRFGKALDYTLWCIAKKSLALAMSDNKGYHTCYIGIGKKIPKFTSAQGVQTAPVLYLQNFDMVTKISFPDAIQQLQFNGENSFSWTISPDDRYIFTCHDNTLIKHDGRTFEGITTYYRDDLDLPLLESVSLRGTTAIWQDNGIGLYDFNNDTYIFTRKNSGLQGAMISPDGEYTYTRQYLNGGSAAIIVSKVTDAGLIERWRLPEETYGIVKWIQEDYSKLLVLEGSEYTFPIQDGENSIKIYNPDDQSILYELNIKYGFFGGIDTESGMLAVWDDNRPNMDDKNKVYLYDYRSGVLIREINLAPRFDNLILYKSHLISGEGFCLNVSDL